MSEIKDQGEMTSERDSDLTHCEETPTVKTPFL